MNIGLFGGSFDPPHVGHVWLADQFMAKAALDEVWILVSPEPPHKGRESMSAYAHRLEMTRLAFAMSQQVKIERVEERLPKPNYTFHTVEVLKAMYPEHSFCLCIGEDSLRDLPRWMEPDRLVSQIGIIVARRGADQGYLEELPAHWKEKITFIELEPTPISSSEIRSRVAMGRSVEGYVAPSVASYMDRHGLYKKAASAL